jgi:hypothetical protein
MEDKQVAPWATKIMLKFHFPPKEANRSRVRKNIKENELCSKRPIRKANNQSLYNS